jgi:hypothetical protein
MWNRKKNFDLVSSSALLHHDDGSMSIELDDLDNDKLDLICNNLGKDFVFQHENMVLNLCVFHILEFINKNTMKGDPENG